MGSPSPSPSLNWGPQDATLGPGRRPATMTTPAYPPQTAADGNSPGQGTLTLTQKSRVMRETTTSRTRKNMRNHALQCSQLSSPSMRMYSCRESLTSHLHSWVLHTCTAGCRALGSKAETGVCPSGNSQLPWKEPGLTPPPSRSHRLPMSAGIDGKMSTASHTIIAPRQPALPHARQT